MYKIALFSGGYGSIAETLIQAINKNIIPNVRTVCIISDRASRSLEIAKKYNLNSYLVDFHKFSSKDDFSDKILELLLENQVDFGFLTFNRILSGKILTTYKNKLINLHPSLLPAFQGFNPLKKAVDCACKFTGVTAHFVDAGTDTGPIINQGVLPISPDSDPEKIANDLFPLRQMVAIESVFAVVNNLVVVDGTKVTINNADYNSLPINPKIRDFERPDLNEFSLEGNWK